MGRSLKRSIRCGGGVLMQEKKAFACCVERGGEPNISIPSWSGTLKMAADMGDTFLSVTFYGKFDRSVRHFHVLHFLFSVHATVLV